MQLSKLDGKDSIKKVSRVYSLKITQICLDTETGHYKETYPEFLYF